MKVVCEVLRGLNQSISTGKVLTICVFPGPQAYQFYIGKEDIDTWKLSQQVHDSKIT